MWDKQEKEFTIIFFKKDSGRPSSFFNLKIPRKKRVKYVCGKFFID